MARLKDFPNYENIVKSLDFRYGRRQGRPIVANTRKMFSNLFSPTFEEYNNLKVLVGYNERTGRVIIVRKAIYD